MFPFQETLPGCTKCIPSAQSHNVTDNHVTNHVTHLEQTFQDSLFTNLSKHGQAVKNISSCISG